MVRASVLECLMKRESPGIGDTVGLVLGGGVLTINNHVSIVLALAIRGWLYCVVECVTYGKRAGVRGSYKSVCQQDVLNKGSTVIVSQGVDLYSMNKMKLGKGTPSSLWLDEFCSVPFSLSGMIKCDFIGERTNHFRGGMATSAFHMG